MSNDEEIHPSQVTIRGKKSALKKSSSKDNLIETEHRIDSLEDLFQGDHVIVINAENRKYCHALVESVDVKESLINVIYYVDTKETQQLSLDQVNGKSGVKTVGFAIDFKKVELYVVDYAPNQCLTREETIEKAKKLDNQTKYNLFTNNDEHFCIFCKTGKAGKLFVLNPADISTKNIFGKSISSKVIGNLAQESGQVLLVNSAKHIATKFPRTAVATVLPVAAEGAAGLLGAGIESASASYDIYKKHKDLKEGKINDVKFKKYVAKRVTRGVNSVAGGIAGGVIGQIVIPIPVVGAVVGGLVGGLIGAAVGQGEGILLGELVEIVDTKIKENKAAANSSVVSETEKFHVLDKLVYKFDKDVLKPEIVIKSEASIIQDASAKINDDDYDIYVLKDSNEIIKELNGIEESISENGIINSRASIEAFSGDQLPETVNVFFKIPEE
jgi:outer membrane lipoprotein SlyB